MMAPRPDRPRVPLLAQLKARIEREGPMRIDTYFQTCLHDADHGYYRRQEVLGAGGDFVTAPEISQAFGELIGLWCAVVWQQMGAPRTVRLIEPGPGRGTLMRDALRAARAVPDFVKALDVLLVESNAVLAEHQRTLLSDQSVPIAWSEDMNDMTSSGGATIVIANEFLDALPVAQWVFRDGKWRDRVVALAPNGDLTLAEGTVREDLELPNGLPAAPQDGNVFESRDGAIAPMMDKLANLGDPLAALFVDYGHLEPGLGDTLQAVRAHHHVDLLTAPGETDLTAQVDFSALKAQAIQRGLTVDGPTTQAQFLGSLGIAERASLLMAANPAKAGEIETAIARLMMPAGMGSRFKVIGLRSRQLEPLPALHT